MTRTDDDAARELEELTGAEAGVNGFVLHMAARLLINLLMLIIRLSVHCDHDFLPILLLLIITIITQGQDDARRRVDRGVGPDLSSWRSCRCSR